MRLRAVFAAALLALLALGASAARGTTAADHGISFAKVCTSPTEIGDPYQCSYTIRNTLDEAQDTLTINGLEDTVHSAGGDLSLGNMLGSVQITVESGATCVAPSGNGTAASPYTGVASCTIPFGGRVNVLPLSHYTVQAADFGLPDHQLTDDASLTWHDLCNDPAGTGNQNCNPNPPDAGSASFTVVQQLQSSTATEIHNSAHQPVTTVEAGSVAHDFVTVTGQPTKPPPSGNVTFEFFTNNTCAGSAPAMSGPAPLDGAGRADAVGFAQGPLAAGFYGFRATYAGDATYTGSVGDCEPLRVVDANIQLTPPTATNRVGTNHPLTCHVNVNDGNGLANAPAGTICTGSLLSGPGSFVGSNQCTTVGTTGDCQLTISSSTAGTTTIRATTTVAVGGVVLTRTTGDGHAGDSPDATKSWWNAAIVIAPNATNEVGQPHTFTVTVLQDTGAGLVPVGSGLPCNITLTPANGANPVPAGPFNLTTNASGQCSATFTSQTGGRVTGHGSSTVTINGVVMNVETDGVAPNSGDAVKTFVDANMQLTPPTATNPVGTNHPLTCHINVNDGSGGFTNAPAGTICTGSLQSGPGSFVGSNQCTTVGTTGDCRLTITSATIGTTTIRATTTVAVGGVVLTRTTGDSHAGDSPDAIKHWGTQRERKEAVLAEIVARRDATPPTQWDYGKLRDAARELSESLEPQFWLDGQHLNPKGGEHVFDNEKAAVGKLREILRDPRSAGMPGYRALLQGWIDRLVEIDRTLASTAIAEATAAGGKADRLSKANEELAKGDEADALGNPQEAIDHYKKAWQHARDSLK
jgi:hypothetical protein